ncbi:hypothetical protein L6452_06445 [Arctium lappa]|uniref:Uncharacterized protein n=1 Tax=Arctium lappa TaxID=4217 RepID=A0ACB9EIJ5_ARCLA|nr:hypothetical protein L6452_06445 [Arctium lappa]
MAGLVFVDDRNELAMLQKPKQAYGFHQIVDFLKSSHVAYALTVNPTIYVEHMRQFWANASIHTEEGCIRIHLRLDDASGITSLSKEDLFQSISRMRYEGPTKVYKFFKSKFSPQWRFFVHTLQHCISRKTTGWSEFSSTLAYALVCLATFRKFVQEILLKKLTDLPYFQEVNVPKPPKGKVFSNMKRPSKDFSRQETPLFSTMMVMSHSHSEASVSKPTSDHPTDDLPTPFISIDTPPIPIVKPTSPITKTYQRKKIQRFLPFLYLHPKAYKPSNGAFSIREYPKGNRRGVSQPQEGRRPLLRSKDLSRVVKTPKGGEDRYTYDELMDTLGTISLEVHNQVLEIKEMKQVIISQQEQIVKLKKMVLKLVHKKKKTKFVLKKRSIDHDASKKGSRNFVKAAEIGKAAVTESTAETEEEVVNAAAETELSIKEFIIAETKKKGKEKMIEFEKPSKKQTQIELDEEMAKKLQEELGKEEEIQSAKDREIALDLSTKLNEEYQRRLKTAAAKKVTLRATKQSQRKPSKTFLANQERRKMINFLKGAVGVPEGMFTNMSFGRIEELCKKEMAKLKGDFTQTVKVGPISVNAPEIIHWDILVNQGKEYFRIKRMGDHYEVYATWGKIIRSCSRSDLEEMHKVGMSLYSKMLEKTGMSLTKMAMEYLCMMFEPERSKATRNVESKAGSGSIYFLQTTQCGTSLRMVPPVKERLEQMARDLHQRLMEKRKMRQIEMKALSTLLLAIPSEYQHQFCNCVDANIMWNALEKRFSGTKSTKRNQKAILKQQYENFMSTKNESITQTFDRFNKLIGELATVGVKMD